MLKKNGQLALNSNYILTHYLSIKSARCRTTIKSQFLYCYHLPLKKMWRNQEWTLAPLGIQDTRWRQTIQKAQHRKLKYEQHEPHQKTHVSRSEFCIIFTLLSIHIRYFTWSFKASDYDKPSMIHLCSWYSSNINTLTNSLKVSQVAKQFIMLMISELVLQCTYT